MKLFFKRLFFRPIYRVDVIDWAIKHHKKYEGICMALYDGQKHAGIKKRQYISLEGNTGWIGKVPAKSTPLVLALIKTPNLNTIIY